MKTVVLGQRPAELDEVIARRKALGQDTHDEVWEGDYHMAPAAHFSHGYVQSRLVLVLEPFAVRAGFVLSLGFNLGDLDNFRVPDLGIHRRYQHEAWLPTAAMVVEVVSPGDESWEKFDFYAAHGVDEVLIVDPHERMIAILVLGAGSYARTDHSVLLGVTANELHELLAWPPSD